MIGCPFPDLPHDAHIVSPSGRESRWSMPKITIRCNQSEDSLVLTCNNEIYVSDNQAALNCTRKLPQGLITVAIIFAITTRITIVTAIIIIIIIIIVVVVVVAITITVLNIKFSSNIS